MTAKLKLKTYDGAIFLKRWGWECRYGGIFVHKLDAPDADRALHDHPWTFGSLVLKGGYTEQRASVTDPTNVNISSRSKWSWKVFNLNECHRIIHLQHPTWTLLIRGPKRQNWSFYTQEGKIPSKEYNGSMVEEVYG